MFDGWLQVIDPKRHTLQPNPTPETMDKQSHEQGLEVGFPTGAAWERLARDMFLQVDASVLYALPKHEGTRVSNRDLAVDSPYNTYRHKGLPPGPIGSPGQKALAAAIDPAPGPWLYYVLADANGKHAFAVTEAEFNRLKAEAHAKGLL